MIRAAQVLRHAAPCAVSLALLVTGSGCTLVGAGVGAGIDSATPGPYEERPAAHHVRLQRGDHVLVRSRTGVRVAGRYMGVHGPTAGDPESYLLVDTDQRMRSLRASDVCSVSVEVSGKGWVYGALIGAAIDGVVVVATVIALQNMDFAGNWADGSSDCFC